jgi:hypothetical protein
MLDLRSRKDFIKEFKGLTREKLDSMESKKKFLIFLNSFLYTRLNINFKFDNFQDFPIYEEQKFIEFIYDVSLISIFPKKKYINEIIEKFKIIKEIYIDFHVQRDIMLLNKKIIFSFDKIDSDNILKSRFNFYKQKIDNLENVFFDSNLNMTNINELKIDVFNIIRNYYGIYKEGEPFESSIFMDWMNAEYFLKMLEFIKSKNQENLFKKNHSNDIHGNKFKEFFTNEFREKHFKKIENLQVYMQSISIQETAILVFLLNNEYKAIFEKFNLSGFIRSSKSKMIPQSIEKYFVAQGGSNNYKLKESFDDKKISEIKDQLYIIMK